MNEVPNPQTPNPENEMTEEEIAKGIVELVIILRQIPDGDKQNIFGSGEFRSVNDIIEHLERRTPAGMEFLKLHRGLNERLSKAKSKEAQEPKSGIRWRIYRLLHKHLL